MSNSKKKTKIRGITGADSEKEEKRDANRKYRRIVKQKVKLGSEDLPNKRETSNVWAFSKDGKRYYSDMDENEMRK